jgi:hypothetical protein
VSRSFRSCAALGLLALLSASGFAQEARRSGTQTKLKITVRVYNYVKMAPQALAAGEREATKIFRRAGLEVEWVDLTDCREGGRTDCHSPLGPADLVLRILARALDQDPAGETLGVALIPLDGSDGTYAAVFHAGVEQLSRTGASSQAQIMGCLVAHEIGHLLLGSDAHSATGVMRPYWTSEELERGAGGQLDFTPQQSEKLRAGVARRLAQP